MRPPPLAAWGSVALVFLALLPGRLRQDRTGGRLSYSYSPFARANSGDASPLESGGPTRALTRRLGFIGDPIECPGAAAGFEEAIRDINDASSILPTVTIVPVYGGSGSGTGTSSPPVGPRAEAFRQLLGVGVDAVVGGCRRMDSDAIGAVAAWAGTPFVALTPPPPSSSSSSSSSASAASLGPVMSVGVDRAEAEGVLVAMLAEMMDWRRFSIVHSDEDEAKRIVDGLLKAVLDRGGSLREGTTAEAATAAGGAFLSRGKQAAALANISAAAQASLKNSARRATCALQTLQFAFSTGGTTTTTAAAAGTAKQRTTPLLHPPHVLLHTGDPERAGRFEHRPRV